MKSDEIDIRAFRFDCKENHLTLDEETGKLPY